MGSISSMMPELMDVQRTCRLRRFAYSINQMIDSFMLFSRCV